MVSLRVSVERCPVCNASRESFVFNDERGEVVCSVCGNVVEESLVDLGPEWRDPEAARAPVSKTPYVSLGTTSMGTIVDLRQRGQITPEVKRKVQLLRRWVEKRTIDSSERAVLDARDVLSQVKALRQIPEYIVRDTEYKYQELVKRGLHGARKEAVIATLVYVCRQREYPCNPKEFIKLLDLDPKKFARAIKQVRELIGGRVQIPKPVKQLPRILAKLDIDDECKIRVQLIAREILSRIERIVHIRNGRSPTVLAAAAVYITCYVLGVRKTQRDIARAAMITEVSLREAYRDIMDSIDLIVLV